jgi:hypothetical protein
LHFSSVVSIGVTTGATFCGVIGHKHRQEYTGNCWSIQVIFVSLTVAFDLTLYLMPFCPAKHLVVLEVPSCQTACSHRLKYCLFTLFVSLCVAQHTINQTLVLTDLHPPLGASSVSWRMFSQNCMFHPIYVNNVGLNVNSTWNIIANLHEKLANHAWV